MNRYHFKCTFADGSMGMRNTAQNTYNAALNAIYFPGPELSHLPTVNEAELIGLQHHGIYKGDNALQNPCQFDIFPAE